MFLLPPQEKVPVLSVTIRHDGFETTTELESTVVNCIALGDQTQFQAIDRNARRTSSPALPTHPSEPRRGRMAPPKNQHLAKKLTFTQNLAPVIFSYQLASVVNAFCNHTHTTMNIPSQNEASYRSSNAAAVNSCGSTAGQTMYQMVAAACWNNVAMASVPSESHQNRNMFTDVYSDVPDDCLWMLTQGLQALHHSECRMDRVAHNGDLLHAARARTRQNATTSNGLDAKMAFSKLNEARNYATKQQSCHTKNSLLLVSMNVAGGDRLSRVDANSPLSMFGRPIFVNTSMVVLTQKSPHIVAAVIMYNAALCYHLKDGSDDDTTDGTLAEFYYRASLTHVEWALRSGLCTLDDVSLLLLATWNNRAHLQCGSHTSEATGTLLQCYESMQCLLKYSRVSLETEEVRIFHLNRFLLEHLGSGLAPAA